MKLINALKFTNLKALFTKTAMVGLVAGAAFMAAPQKANAQVAFGVHFGRPIYRRPYYAPPVYIAPVGPAYAYGPAYYGYDHRYWDRREHWDRDHRFYR